MKKTGDEDVTAPSEEVLHAKILAVSKDPVLTDMVVACINAPWYERWPDADGQVEMQVIGENITTGENLLERVRGALVASEYFVVLAQHPLITSSPKGLVLRIKADAKGHLTSAQLVNQQLHLLWAWHPTALEAEAATPTRSASTKTILP
jgi:hypothetical protein